MSNKAWNLSEKHISLGDKVIGCVLSEPNVLEDIQPHVRISDFPMRHHKVIWREAGNAWKQYGSIDWERIVEALVLDDTSFSTTETDARQVVYALLEAGFQIHLAEAFAKELAQVAQLQRIHEILPRADMSINSLSNPDEVVANLMAELEASGRKSQTSELKTLASVAKQRIDVTKSRIGNGAWVTGVPTGFDDLDYVTQGWQNGELIIIASRPGMGKTSLMMHHAICAAQKSQSVAVFSLEMSLSQLTDRTLSSWTHIPLSCLRTGQVTDTNLKSLERAQAVFSELSIVMDDTPKMTVQDIASRCRTIQRTHGLDIVFVDYLQLISTDAGRRDRHTEVAEIARDLKSLSKKLNVPIIALAQLSRAVESQKDKKPMLSHLGESSGLEKNADIVIFIHRDEYYEDKSVRKFQTSNGSVDIEEAEIIIGKNRNGAVGAVKVGWIPSFTSFVELDDRHQASEPSEEYNHYGEAEVDDLWRDHVGAEY